MDPEELPQKVLPNLSLSQLLYILQRIQQLCSAAPDHAKKLLTENPQLSLAMIHAEYLVGARADRLLPLTSDEVRLAKERLYQMRNPGGQSRNQLASTIAPQSNEQSNEVALALSKLDSSVLSALTGGAEVVDMGAIVASLLRMSDDQIAQLPEEVQLVLLTALQSTM